MVSSGGIAGTVIGLMAAEYAALSAWHRRSGRGIAGPDLAPTLLAGGALALALGSALAGQPRRRIDLLLLAALAAHLADLRRRWR